MSAPSSSIIPLVEGFSGQHMVVLPAPLRRELKSHPLLRALLVTDAGYFPKALGHHVKRPKGAPTDLLILCLHGSGWVKSGGRLHTINPGDLVWLAADEKHSYGSSEEDPWSLVWAHFQGEEIPEWKHLLGWERTQPLGLLHVGPEHCTELELDRLYSLLEYGYSIPQLLSASAALRHTLCTALRLHLGSALSRSARERTLLVRDQLQRSPSQHFLLSELAAKAGLSTPHFSLLFRQLTGYAPIDFLIRQRIRQACRLLDTSRLGVAQIATETGFSDPYYFSRCFKRVMGQPPLAYRKVIKA